MTRHRQSAPRADYYPTWAFLVFGTHGLLYIVVDGLLAAYPISPWWSIAVGFTYSVHASLLARRARSKPLPKLTPGELAALRSWTRGPR